MLPTIVSRCQRFDLRRISPEKILAKLKQILKDLDFKADPDALHLIAAHADGSMRDAESLLDRLLCFHEGEITPEKLSETLGLVSRDLFFKLDNAASQNDLLFAFQLSEQVFKEGAHLEYFLENLAEHYRNILLVKLGKHRDLASLLTQAEQEKYLKSEALYTQEQCLEILDILRMQLEQLQKSPFKRIDLEILLLQIIRSMKKLPLDSLVNQLIELKSSINSPTATPIEAPPPVIKKEVPPPPIKEEEVDDIFQKKILHNKVMRFASVELNGSIRKG